MDGTAVEVLSWMTNYTAKFTMVFTLLTSLLISCASFAESAEPYLDEAILKGDYYQILGVSKNASEAEIKTAFRALCRKYHPQYGHVDGADIRTLIHAYSCLKDAKRRAEYDAKLGSKPWVDTTTEFSAAWFMSMTGTGHEFSVDLSDFSLEEVLNRSEKYERFVAWFSRFIVSNVSPDRPLWFYDANPIAKRWSLLWDLSFKIKLVMGLAVYAPFYKPEPAAYMLPVLAYGLFEFIYWNAARGNVRQVDDSTQKVSNIIKRMAKTKDNETHIKEAILNYDMVEILAFANLRNLQKHDWLFHQNMKVIGKNFPLLYQGWLLRSLFDSGTPMNQKPLQTDIKAHPNFWNDQLDELEAFAPGVITDQQMHELRKGLGLADKRALMSTVGQLAANISFKSKLVCDRILATLSRR